MKKIFKLVAIIVPVLIVVVLLGVYFSLSSIVRSAVEKKSAASLNVPTTVGGASVSLMGGSVGLSNFDIGSPKGFSAPHMFTLGGVNLDVDYGQLTKDPVRVRKLTLDKPVLVVEQSGGKFNFKELMDQLPKDPDAPSKEKRGENDPIRLIIDSVDVNNAVVSIRPGIPGVQQQIDIPIPSMTLTQIGTADDAKNGVAIKEVTMQLMTAMVGKAMESDKLPPELRQLMSLDVKAMADRFSGEIKKQLDAITRDPAKAVEDILKNPDSLKDKGKELEQGLKGLIPGKKDDKPKEKAAPK